MIPQTQQLPTVSALLVVVFKHLKQKNMKLNKWHTFAAIAAFGAVISFIHSGSYSAEVKHNSALFVVLGSVLTLATGYFLYKTKQTSN